MMLNPRFCKLAGTTYCLMDKHQKQFFLYVKAEFDIHHHKDSTLVLKTYIKALKETFPEFSLESNIDFTGHQLILSEIKILLGIGLILYEDSQFHKAVSIFTILEQYLQDHSKLELEQYALLYPAVTDLYAQCLFATKNYKKSALISPNRELPVALNMANCNI